MNVNLVYLNNGYNFDVYQSSSLSYFYEIACKVFHLNKKTIVLYYLETKLPDSDHISVSSFFKKKPSSISITVQLLNITLPQLNHRYFNSISYARESSQNKIKKALPVTQLANQSILTSSKEKLKGKKNKKKESKINCQLCGMRSALYYCRKCNEFVCLECNTKYSEHIRHQLLEIENSNYEQCTYVYEKEVLNQISVIQTAFRKTNEWNNINKIRSEYLNEFIARLQEIDSNAMKITSSKINKNFELNEQTFFTLRQYIYGLLNGENGIS